MTSQDCIQSLKAIVGAKNIYTKDRDTAFYQKGWRSGEGAALAVVFPATRP